VSLTAKQREAREILSSLAVYIMLFGGSRSGKTFLIVRQIVTRAMKAPGSRHAILRFRFNHLKASIIADTFPKVMAACFKDVTYHLDKSDWFVKLPNGAEIWFGGLDDKERTEKILGMEFATIYLNECSQISWASVGVAMTRLAQKVAVKVKGMGDEPLALRMYFDCNPPNKAHWTYKVFIEKVDPETKKAHPQPDLYASFQMNPQDNVENLATGYLDTLRGLSARLQKRFLAGEFADATPNQLFRDEDIDKWRVTDGKLPEFVRIAIGVDPSGSGDEDNADNDAIGIVVAGLGTDGNAYVLEDCTVKAGPATWGRVATSAFDRHAADVIAAEENFGGAMVKSVIDTARPRTPYKRVIASRGKHVRAEPFSALYEQGKVRHAGEFRELEDELTAFSTIGYTGQGSPNRADALIFALAELFPALTAPKAEKKAPMKPIRESRGSHGWLGR
jgi:phage terminase large subunit-like protein